MKTHGRTNSPEFGVWENMKTRCYNSNYSLYHRYGGRGITVCDRWLQSFENFLEDMGTRPDGLTIERKDSDGNYEPNNCVWASKSEQARNRRTSRVVTYRGETKTLMEFCEKLGLPYKTIFKRLSKGVPVDKALNTPIRRYTLV